MRRNDDRYTTYAPHLLSLRGSYRHIYPLTNIPPTLLIAKASSLFISGHLSHSQGLALLSSISLLLWLPIPPHLKAPLYASPLKATSIFLLNLSQISCIFSRYLLPFKWPFIFPLPPKSLLFLHFSRPSILYSVQYSSFRQLLCDLFSKPRASQIYPLLQFFHSFLTHH